MGLEACDRAWLTGLSDDVDGLPDAYGDFNLFKVLVEGDKHSRLYSAGQIKQQIMRVLMQRTIDINETEERCQKPSKRDGALQEPLRIEWLKLHQPLAQMDQSLRDTCNKELLWVLVVIRGQLAQVSGES